MKKLPKLSTMRNKCDALLTPIIKEIYPRCLLNTSNCSSYTQVAHHHIHKSRSTRLRYELDNLIPLCHHCHVVLHHNESYHASKIIEIKGIEWFKELDKMKDEYVKADVHWYIEQYERLKDYCG
jgi:5-methylcytosine-specific restriction endonuclease McrA